MKLPSHIASLIVLLVLAISGSILNARAETMESSANLTGTWKWIAPTNPDGKVPDITFTLKAEGETVTGTINQSRGTTEISNGKVKGNAVSFQVIREGKAGKSVTTYSGKLSGDTVKGKLEVKVGDKTLDPQDWEIQRVKK